MSKLMWIAGILLAAAGVAAGAIVLLALAPVPGLTLETAAILLVGGTLSLGLGSAIEQLRRQLEALPEPLAEPSVESSVESSVGSSVEPVVEEAVPPAPAPIPRFDPRTAKPSVEPPADAAQLEVSQPTLETIEALERARKQIAQAFEPKKSEATAVTAAAQASEPVKSSEPDLPTAVAEAFEEELVEDQAIEAAQLYVVEERFIRDRAARILSDGTVEAETDEGWMRFENLEHLNEYFDAMEAART